MLYLDVYIIIYYRIYDEGYINKKLKKNRIVRDYIFIIYIKKEIININLIYFIEELYL